MVPRRTIIEIAANSVRSAMAAEAGGADRVELCEFLEGGGVTPSFGAISVCREQVNLPLHVLIRPRVGDFVFSNEEAEIMLRDITLAYQLGCNGVVIGALRRDGHIDRELCLGLLEAAGDMKVVFHRAIDCVTELEANWAVLTELHQHGLHGVLTSGAADNAMLGAQQIAHYVADHHGLEIIAGAGVNADNVQALIQTSGAHAVHASAKQLQTSTAAMRKISGLGGDYWQTEQTLVTRLVQAAHS